MEPLLIDYHDLINNDMEAHDTLTHISRWYFHKLKELGRTKHDPELFRELAKQVSQLSSFQLYQLSTLEYDEYPQNVLLEVSVLVDGTESWRYKHCRDWQASGTYWTDQRLKHTPRFPRNESRPKIGVSDFGLPGPTERTIIVVLVTVAVLLLAVIWQLWRVWGSGEDEGALFEPIQPRTLP